MSIGSFWLNDAIIEFYVRSLQVGPGFVCGLRRGRQIFFSSLNMSGHSKWANIRVRKTAQDKVRGKIYTKHAKLIEIVAQRGGDPSMNPSLRTAIENAKADSVPNANIERAIKKGTGELKGDKMVEVIYAGYGPGNTALIIECLTDNTNRTLNNVRTILSKNGGHFADSSSVLWMFQRKGVVTTPVETSRQGVSFEEMELSLIDLGAENIEFDNGTLTITTDLHNWTKVRDFLKGKGMTVESAGLQYVPTQKSVISDQETAQKLMHLIEAIEEDEDVAEVHTNAEIEEAVASQL